MKNFNILDKTRLCKRQKLLKFSIQNRVTQKFHISLIWPQLKFKGCNSITVTGSADFGFIPDNSTTLTPPGSPGVSREAKLSTEFEFGSLVR